MEGAGSNECEGSRANGSSWRGLIGLIRLWKSVENAESQPQKPGMGWLVCHSCQFSTRGLRAPLFWGGPWALGETAQIHSLIGRLRDPDIVAILSDLGVLLSKVTVHFVEPHSLGLPLPDRTIVNAVRSVMAFWKDSQDKRRAGSMISTCSNPCCSATFIHRQGRLFRLPKRPMEDGRPANTHSVQHFWLCADCCETYSLEYDESLGVAITLRLQGVPAPRLRQIIAKA